MADVELRSSRRRRAAGDRALDELRDRVPPSGRASPAVGVGALVRVLGQHSFLRRLGYARVHLVDDFFFPPALWW